MRGANYLYIATITPLVSIPVYPPLSLEVFIGGYFYLRWNQNDDEPQQINRAVDVSAFLLPLVAISVSEAELGGRFIMQKRARYYASPSKKWAGNKAQPRYLSTITRREEFATEQSNDNDCER